VIEAMAAGLPVIAARAAALPETLGSAGLSFTPDDVDDLVRQIRRVLAGSDCTAQTKTNRIAIVGPRFGGNFAGGAERSLERIADALRATGKQVALFALKTTAEALVAELVERQGEFDAIIVGPAIHELARAVAARLPAKTVLLPCFHDEPQARTPELLGAARGVSGILYHTPEEQAFAEAELGINHPHAAVIGSWIDAEPGDAARGRQRCGERYVVYCGRYCREKGFDLLLDWMRRYRAEHSDSVRLVLMGENGAHVPREPWLVDLGFVSEQLKRDLLAGACALIQLSVNESLSLVALEAWSQGVPMIAQRACAVLQGQIERSGGGLTVTDWNDFAAALNSLGAEPELWRERGANGRAYVRSHYQSEARFAEVILDLLTERSQPLATTLARKGKERAAGFCRAVWEERFASIIDEVLALPVAAHSPELRIEPQVAELRAEAGSERVLLPLRVTNVGQWPAAARGPAQVKLNVRVGDRELTTALPTHLLPGATQLVVVPAPVPDPTGLHAVEIGVTPSERIPCTAQPIRLEVVPAGQSAGPNGLVENVRQTVARLQGRQTLPDDYQDITHGPLAGVKRRIKQKLLHNFRTAYVDVLARQQSEFNSHVVTALCQLADCSAVAGQTPANGEAAKTQALLRKTLRGQRRLERRLARLEQSFETLARSCP
jgi:glycosyltransferase involved in cell wall biosynthesis